MPRRNYIFLGALLFVLCIPVTVMAFQEEPKEVTAIGVSDGKSSKARDEALNDALRKAVEQGVGTFVTTQLSVEQQRLVEERIYTQSQGYIQQYRVVREGLQEDLYEVEISALVKMGKLADDLKSIGLVIRKKRNPRVMVAIYSSEIKPGTFWEITIEGNRNAENQIEAGLLQKGFQLVDADQVRHKKELETLLLEGDPSGASKIAKDYGAEVLVHGDVRRNFVDVRPLFGRPTRFFSNEVRVKAHETDTGKLLYSGYRTRPPSGAGALFPLEEATSELIDEMVVGILEQWRKDVYQAGSYQLNLSKISFSNLSKFKANLGKIRGVRDLQVRSFQSGHAQLEVSYQGPLEELADKINAMKSPRTMITGLQSNTLDIAIRD